MASRIDIDEIESTRSEKFLAVVLAAFLLIGSIWFYVKVDDWIGGARTWQFTPGEQKVMDARDAAWRAQEQADLTAEREKTDVDLAKDKLDLALAKHEPTEELETDYRRELEQFDAARAAAESARTKADALNDRAGVIEKKHQVPYQTTARRWAVAGARLGFILAWFAVSLRLVGGLRSRQSRFLPLGFAAVGTAVITALVFATDYILDYIDPLDLGPIVLSAVGAAATIGSFVGLQRWLARRIPERRVRNGECPFCGHPVRGGGTDGLGRPHCEGCGREVVAPCATCGAPRRVGSAHCSACGSS